MSERPLGFQVTPTPQQGRPQQQQAHIQQQIQQKRQRAKLPSSLSEFIVDDLKLFTSPVTVVVDEFLKQLKR